MLFRKGRLSKQAKIMTGNKKIIVDSVNVKNIGSSK